MTVEIPIVWVFFMFARHGRALTVNTDRLERTTR